MWFDVRTFEFSKDQDSPETTEDQSSPETTEDQDSPETTEDQGSPETTEGRSHPKSEDAFGVNPETGVAVIADGASSGMFSGPWARILVDAAAQGSCPVDPNHTAQLTDWLKPLREQWLEEIPPLSGLNWNQKRRLQECGGGYTTLLWIETAASSTADGADIETSDESDRVRFLCRSVGDCCLFHVRNGALLHSFPISDSNELEATPLTICSVNRGRDAELQFRSHSLDCCRDDLVVLATDAIAKWLLEQQESNVNVDWDTIWTWPVEDWQDFIGGLRAERDIRHDDTTLVMLKILAEPTQQPSSPETTDGPGKVDLPETPPKEETGGGWSNWLRILFCVAVGLAVASSLSWLNR